MRIDVLFGAHAIAPAEVSGRVVAIIDVLRASTTIAAALANGARAVFPLENPEEIVNRSKSFERSDVRTAGERKMLAIPGFDLGNSPLEFTREAVEGKTILLTTTNGTAALLAVQNGAAREVLVASYVNFTPVLGRLRAAARAGVDVSLVCAGRERQFSLEDAACAGRFVKQLARRRSTADLNDAARTCVLLNRRYGDRLDRLFADSAHGRALAEAGFAADLDACARVDAWPVVPVYQDRQIMLASAAPQRGNGR